MSDTANNVALGLGVAVLGFALFTYFRKGSSAVTVSPQAAKTGAVPSNGVIASAGIATLLGALTNGSGQNALPGVLTNAGSSLGSLWDTLTFPSGGTTADGGSPLSIDQTFSSTSWNPDSISTQIGQDTATLLGQSDSDTLNQWGFTL